MLVTFITNHFMKNQRLMDNMHTKQPILVQVNATTPAFASPPMLQQNLKLSLNIQTIESNNCNQSDSNLFTKYCNKEYSYFTHHKHASSNNYKFPKHKFESSSLIVMFKSCNM